MKNLIFIDNDHDCPIADEGVQTVKRQLRIVGKLNLPYVDGMKVVSGFGHKNKDEMYKMIYDPNNIIVSWAMYTATHYNSLGQLRRFLSTAGVSKVVGCTYVDTSGEIVEALERIFRNDDKETYSIMNAIELNNIITFHDHSDVSRLRIELKGRWESPFNFEPFDLKKHSKK